MYFYFLESSKVIYFLQQCVNCSLKRQSQKHLYSALHGIQTTLKRSGMDHTVLPDKMMMMTTTTMMTMINSGY